MKYFPASSLKRVLAHFPYTVTARLAHKSSPQLRRVIKTNRIPETYLISILSSLSDKILTLQMLATTLRATLLHPPDTPPHP